MDTICRDSGNCFDIFKQTKTRIREEFENIFERYRLRASRVKPALTSALKNISEGKDAAETDVRELENLGLVKRNQSGIPNLFLSFFEEFVRRKVVIDCGVK